MRKTTVLIVAATAVLLGPSASRRRVVGRVERQAVQPLAGEAQKCAAPAGGPFTMTEPRAGWSPSEFGNLSGRMTDRRAGAGG